MLLVFHVPILKLGCWLDHPSPGNPIVPSNSATCVSEVTRKVAQRAIAKRERSRTRLGVHIQEAFQVSVLNLEWGLHHPSSGSPSVLPELRRATLLFFALCSKPTPLPPNVSLLIFCVLRFPLCRYILLDAQIVHLQ